jgi:hypothetical protein
MMSLSATEPVMSTCEPAAVMVIVLSSLRMPGELAASVVELSPDLAGLLRRAAPLTDYAWKFRYPRDAQ